MSKFISLFLLFIFCANITAQNPFSHDTPDLQDGVIYISKFIASGEFIEMRSNISELSAIDSLYLRTLNYMNGDFSESLLVLTFATIPFSHMNLSIFGISFNIQLPAVDEDLFTLKVNNLPSKLFLASPRSGDSDKIAHFFGNAFLSYNIRILNISEYMGRMVELFESTFKVQGGLDDRDLIINRFGSFFGKSLKEKDKLLPSDILNIFNFLTYIVIRF